MIHKLSPLEDRCVHTSLDAFRGYSTDVYTLLQVPSEVRGYPTDVYLLLQVSSEVTLQMCRTALDALRCPQRLPYRCLHTASGTQTVLKEVEWGRMLSK